MGVEINSLLGLLHLALVVWAILSIADSRDTRPMKVVWVVLVLVLPLIGFVIWLFFGPRGGRR